MSISQPGIFERTQERLFEYTRQHRDLTACVLLTVAYLVFCLLLHLPYYYVGLALAGAVVLGISLKYPFAAYLGYVFVILFFPYKFIVSETYTLAKIGGGFLLAVTIGAAAIRTQEFKRRIKRAFDRRGIAVLILIMGASISTIVTPNPMSDFFEQHVQFLVLFALTRMYVDTEKRLWWLLAIILLARGLDSAQGIYQSFSLPHGVRIAANFIDPNEYACYTLIAIPIAIYLAQYKKRVAFFQIGIIVLGLLTFPAIIMSYSRAGFITLALVLIIIFCIPVGKFRHRFLLLIVTILIVLAVIPFDYWTRIETISGLFEGGNVEHSIEIRKQQIETSIHFFMEHPIFGVGYEHFRGMPEKQFGGYVITRWRLTEHSTILQVLVEFGLIGFIPFVFLIFLTFRSGIRAVKMAKSANDTGMRLLAAATTVSFTSLMISSFMLGTYTKYLYLLFALPMVAHDLMTDKLSKNVTATTQPLS